MNAQSSQLIRRTGLLAGAVFSLVGISLFADTAAPAGSTLTSDDFPTFSSYVKISGQAPSITGDKAAFQERMRQPDAGSAGIEDLHYIKDLDKDTALTIDGRALGGAGDYLAQFRVSKNEVGTFEAGYKRFRTYYDGVGGFFPLNNQWMPLTSENLHTDRSKFWVQGTINMPHVPLITLSYTNELRDGEKDSTIWGTTDLTGLPFNLVPYPVSPARKITPSYLQLNERHQVLELSLKQTFGKTTVQLAVLGDQTNNLDTRFVTLFPGEVIPWSIASLSNTVPQTSTTGISPQAAAKNLVSASNWNNQVLLQQSDGIATKTYDINGKIDTVITDQLTLHFAGNYQRERGNDTGERPLVTSTATATDIVPVTTATFTRLIGSSKVKTLTGSATLDYTPIKDLLINVGVRAEDEYINGSSTYAVLAASGTPAVTVAATTRMAYAHVRQHSATPVAELRYTGIKDLALYFTGSKRSLNGDETNSSQYNPLSPSSRTLASNNLNEDHGDYKLGANWRACSALSLRAELFTKHHQFESAGYFLQSDNAYDYYLLDSQFKGLKLTAIAKPLSAVTFTTRVVSQRGKMNVTGFLPIYTAFDSCDAKNLNLGETIDWTPSKVMYVQASGNLVYNSIDTIYPRAGVTPAGYTTYTTSHATVLTALPYDTNRVLQNANNNYGTASLLVGFVADARTDIQIQYTYYRASNGNPALAAMTQPYGAAARDSVVSLGIKHKFNDRFVMNAKVGYADSKNDTTGGFTNFRGPLAYVSIEHAL